MILTTEFIAVGSTSVICEEERQDDEIVYRLPRIKQSYNQEQVSVTKNQ